MDVLDVKVVLKIAYSNEKMILNTILQVAFSTQINWFVWGKSQGYM
jgi:hypothetical protein